MTCSMESWSASSRRLSGAPIASCGSARSSGETRKPSPWPCPRGSARSPRPVAPFGSGEIVAYLLRRGRRLRLFVFRTLDVDARFAPTVLVSFHASDCSWSRTLPCAFGEPEASSRISRALAATRRP